jgi:hypothetical protein
MPKIVRFMNPVDPRYSRLKRPLQEPGSGDLSLQRRETAQHRCKSFLGFTGC